MSGPEPRGVVGWFSRLTLGQLAAFVLIFPLLVALLLVFGLFPLIAAWRGG
ncbi:hypothetical protein LPC08_11890 [Roseomonas sp. OT10]|uniref:hypothetical protein n=1 Tax=Roseomonas cutis TaxID=2897332 RepID=UPI001E471011|nr:hypothetical protein [Roseomonas sp. OT10]UFN51249.1 hypothetical protein LPC08_11890 [Roseomonas sp. OT10]